jgi:hypothetical protein
MAGVYTDCVKHGVLPLAARGVEVLRHARVVYVYHIGSYVARGQHCYGCGPIHVVCGSSVVDLVIWIIRLRLPTPIPHLVDSVVVYQTRGIYIHTSKHQSLADDCVGTRDRQCYENHCENYQIT